MSAQTNVNVDQLEEIITYLVENNRLIQSEGMIPTALAVEGGSGIGKTSTVLQVGNRLGLDVVKLNLSQIEELGDLVGFPIRQFEVCKNVEGVTGEETNCMWIDEHAVDTYVKMGYMFTGQNRMSYCPPEWIAGKTRGVILILDDFNRADQRFMQATMELIDRQQYISWKLPQDSHIILTCNPDNGDYNVTSLDNAQKTRFVTSNLKFDLDCWGRWAEGAGIDNRCINFLLMHPELVTDKVNARSITTFFNTLKSMTDFDKRLPLIQMLGEGSVGGEFSTLFTLFINNKLDRLMNPKDILLNGTTENVINALKKDIGSGQSYRADIASTLATRIQNFAILYANDNPIDKVHIERIASIVKEDVFANDLKYNIVKKIVNGNRTKFKLLTLDKDLVKYVLA